MDLERLKNLAGVTENDMSKYKEPKATHAKKPGGDVVKQDNEMDMMHGKTTKHSTYKEPKADHSKKPGGKVVKDSNTMDMHHGKTTNHSTYNEPKATHSKKLGGDVVKEWADQIVESGDVETVMRELLVALEEKGVKF